MNQRQRNEALQSNPSSRTKKPHPRVLQGITESPGVGRDPSGPTPLQQAGTPTARLGCLQQMDPFCQAAGGGVTRWCHFPAVTVAVITAHVSVLRSAGSESCRSVLQCIRLKRQTPKARFKNTHSGWQGSRLSLLLAGQVSSSDRWVFIQKRPKTKPD